MDFYTLASCILDIIFNQFYIIITELSGFIIILLFFSIAFLIIHVIIFPFHINTQDCYIIHSSYGRTRTSSFRSSSFHEAAFTLPSFVDHWNNIIQKLNTEVAVQCTVPYEGFFWRISYFRSCFGQQTHGKQMDFYTRVSCILNCLDWLLFCYFFNCIFNHTCYYFPFPY